MTSEDSKISIIMPVFNAEKYLGEAIESVLHQTYKNWELLIINDGSTDGSKEKVRQYADDRIQYFEQQNQGVSVARNVGLQNMEGDFFCFLDADDVLPGNSLKSRLKIFDQSENIEFVDGQVDVYDHNFQQVVRTWKPSFNGKPLQELLSLKGSCFLGNTWMVKHFPNKRYSFKEGLSHCEDLLFYIDVASDGGEYAYTTDTILHYRTGHTSAMSNLEGLERGYREIYQEIQRMKNVPPEWKKKYYRKVKSIMVKSYLGKANIIKAIRTFFK